jgi:hypothetical protein
MPLFRLFIESNLAEMSSFLQFFEAIIGTYESIGKKSTGRWKVTSPTKRSNLFSFRGKGRKSQRKERRRTKRNEERQEKEVK